MNLVSELELPMEPKSRSLQNRRAAPRRFLLGVATLLLAAAPFSRGATLSTVNTLTGATEDTAFTISHATLQAAANESADTIAFQLSSVTSGTLRQGGLPVNPGARIAVGQSWVWTPALNQNGTINAFQIAAWDGTNASTTPVQVRVSVAAVNDPPTISNISGATIDEDGFYLSSAFTVGDVETSADLLTLSGSSGNTTLVPNNRITFAVTGSSTRTVRVEPAANQAGTVLITVAVNDGATGTSTSFTLVVRAVNDAPTLTAVTPLTGATNDTPFTITYALLAAAANEGDVDGTTVSFRVESVTQGTLTQGGVNVGPGTNLLTTTSAPWIYSAGGSTAGELDAFQIRAWDGTLDSGADVQVKVIVTGPPEVPNVAVSINPDTIVENQEVTPFVLLIGESALNHTNYTVYIETLGGTTNFVYGTLDPPGPFVGNRAEVQQAVSSVRYRAGRTAIGAQMETFRFRVVDAVGREGADTNSISIVGVNDPPQITGVSPLTFATDEPNEPPVVPFPNVLIDDPDVGQQLTVTITLSDPTLGALSTNTIVSTNRSVLNAALNQVTFKPNRLGENVTVVLGLTVNDGVISRSNNDTRIAVTAVNNPPQFLNIPAEQPVAISPLPPVKPFRSISIADEDTNALTLTVSLDDPTKGTFTNLLATGFSDLGGGVYRITATPLAASTALQQLAYRINPAFPFPPDLPGDTEFTLVAEDFRNLKNTRILRIVLREQVRNLLVTNESDEADSLEPSRPKKGSLRRAVEDSNSGDVITFALPEYPALIRLTRPIELNRNLLFKGPGADLLTISGDTNGNQLADIQLFRVSSTVGMEGITLTKGLAQGEFLTGGAVYVGPNGNLTLSYCAVTDSQAEQWGGGIDVDQGSLTLQQCLVRGNSTGGNGGFGGGGVSLYTDQPCSFVNTTFSGNHQSAPSGLGGGALFVENVTFSTELPVEVTHCTFAENTDASGQGSSIHSKAFGAMVRVKNSIFADGQDRNLEVDGGGRIVSLGGNLSDDEATASLGQGGQAGSIVFLDQFSDWTNTVPRLLPLDVRVKPTAGYPLMAGSPAIDAAASPAAPTDQRGVIRGMTPGSLADIGALEFDASARLVIHEIHFSPDAGETQFVELYVPRDSVPVNLSGFSLSINTTNVHVFAPNAIVQPGFGYIVANAAMSASGTPVVIHSEPAPLGLTELGLVEVIRPGLNGGAVVRAVYADKFVDPDDPANFLPGVAHNSLTLAPQFGGFAYLPHKVVAFPPWGGARYDASGNLVANGQSISPGKDSAEKVFGALNSSPLAVADVVLVGEDEVAQLDALGNDIDADGLDRLVIVDVSQTEGEGGDESEVMTGQKARVRVAPADSPLRGTAIFYDPRGSTNLQSLAEGVEKADAFFYEIVDIGTGPIVSFSGTPSSSPVTARSPAHRLTNNVEIKISGSSVVAYNDRFIITPIDEDTFTIPIAFSGDSTNTAAWVTTLARIPSERSESRVAVTVLGANDPPVPVADAAATVEGTVLRIMGDPNLAGSSTVFESDAAYGGPLQISPVSLLQNDGDVDTDDDASTLNVVGVASEVFSILNYDGNVGESPVSVKSPNHGLADGTVILISGYGGHPSYNGYHPVSVVDSNTYTIPVMYLDNHTKRGVWGILNDATRLSAASVYGAEVHLEIRANRTETSIVYNPRASEYLNGLTVGVTANDWFYYAVEDRHGAVSFAPVVVRVMGENDEPEPAADPDSIALLEAGLDNGTTLAEAISQLRVQYALPSNSGSPGRADVEARLAGGTGMLVFISDIWTTSEDSPLSIMPSSLLANDQDVDRNDTLQVVSADAFSREGAKVTLNMNTATITYNPADSTNLNRLAREELLIDTFETTISDGHGGLVNTLVSVLVVGINDSPVALDEVVETSGQEVITLNPVQYPPDDPSRHDYDPDINGAAPDNRLALIPATNWPSTVPGVRVNIENGLLTYDPTQTEAFARLGQGEVFEDAVSYTITDGSFVFANDDFFKVQADGSGYVLNILGNDRNFTVSGGNLQVTEVGAPSRQGVASLDSTGTNLLYTPQVNFVGDEVVTYTVSDPFGNTDSALVRIRVTVNQLNGNLQANADFFSVAKGEAPTLNVLANDNILPQSGSGLILSSVTQPNRDRVVLAGNQITYIQEAAGPFPYTESFSYAVSGGGTAAAIATVTVRVVNREGTLNIRDDAFSVPVGSLDNPLDVLANDNLLPGSIENLRIREVLGPIHGSASINAGGVGLLYTPTNGFAGGDTLMYVASDGQGGTGTGTVSIVIGSLTTSIDFFVVPTNAVNLLDVLANDRVLQSGVGSVHLESVTPTSSPLGAMSVYDEGRSLRFASGRAAGETTFAYVISDGSARATGSVVVVVFDPGAGEELNASPDYFSVLTDSSANELDVLTNDVAIPSRGRPLTIVSVGTGLNAPNRGGTVVLNETNDRLLYAPAPGFVGEEAFTYTMTDSRQTDTAKVVVRVTSGDLLANPDAFTVFFELPAKTNAPLKEFTLPVLANDRVLPDFGQALSITSVEFDNVTATNAPIEPGQIRLAGDQVNLIYVPRDREGPFPYVERFKYEITDGTSRRAEAILVVEVQQRAEAQTLDTHPDNFTVEANSQNNALAVLANDNVKPATAVGWSITYISPTAYNAVAIVNGSTIQYSPPAGFVGTDTFTYSVSDGLGGTGAASISVKVGDQPLCPDQFVAISGSKSNSLDVLSNDGIFPGNSADYELTGVTMPDRNGAVSVSGGQLLYAPALNYNGSFPYLENFSYIVADDSGNTVMAPVTVTVYQERSDQAMATVTFRVVGENELPVISGTRADQRVYYRSSLRPFSGVAVRDRDSNGQQPLIITVTLNDPGQGLLTSLGGFTDQGFGEYVLKGAGSGVTPAAASAALQGLIYVPTGGNSLGQGMSATNRIFIRVDDRIAASVLDATTTVIARESWVDEEIPPDRINVSNFGQTSIAASRDWIVVGAPQDALYNNSGSAYVYARRLDGSEQWDLVKKLLSPDPGNGDEFGYSVAVNGELIAVGAPSDDERAFDSGAVYVFGRHQGGTNQWGLVKKITATDAILLDRFGRAVGLEGSTLAVGAPLSDSPYVNTGSVYLFAQNQGGANQWGQIKKLTAGDAGFQDQFGTALSLNGETLVVGAPFDDDRGESTGSAYVFARHQGGSNAWGQVQKLIASDGLADDRFGISVAIDGNTLVVGAPYDDYLLVEWGSAYVFTKTGSGATPWLQTQQLRAADGAGNDFFGNAVAISGNYLAVGAPYDDDSGLDSGSIYLYELHRDAANQWGLSDKLRRDAPVRRFGLVLALNQNTLAASRQVFAVGIWSGALSIHRLRFNNAPLLTQPIPDQIIAAGATFDFTVPSETFGISELGGLLTYQASLEDGSALPAWLSFDALSARFVGMPSLPDVGLMVVKVSVANEEGAEAFDLFHLTVLRSPYEIWQRSVFGADLLADGSRESLIWGDGADPDKDRVVNRLEYVYGSNALMPTSEPGIYLAVDHSLSGGQLTVMYLRRTNDLTLAYALLASSDLVTWTAADSWVASETTLPVEDGIEMVMARIQPSAAANGLKFFRVKLDY